MGVVTVFSTEGCPHCARAKGILSKNGINYNEVSLTEYPNLRQNMTKLSKKLTVPQIFFNANHVGGASELKALENNGALETLWFKTQNEPAPDGDVGELLRKPDYAPDPKPTPSPRSLEIYTMEENTKDSDVSNDLKMSAVEVVQAIDMDLSKKFSGNELIGWVNKRLGRPEANQDLAIKLAKKMIVNGLIISVDDKSSHLDSSSVFLQSRFKLYKSRQTTALNLYRRWIDRVDDQDTVALNLKHQLSSLLTKHRDEEGLVDYLAASEDPLFTIFEEATCELQAIKLDLLEPNTRLAFIINVYNMLTLHAFTKIGIPMSSFERADFFDNHGYDIGGSFFTFSALENGLLRKNKVPPYHTRRTIPVGDVREKSIMPILYPQIHAALNCGAKSCPPIKTFSKKAVLEEIDIAASAFFEDDSNCLLDITNNTVSLTKIVLWYKSDFENDQHDILSTVRHWLSGEKAKAMDELLSTKAHVKVKYFDYDWTTDNKRAKKYSRHANIVSIATRLSLVP